MTLILQKYVGEFRNGRGLQGAHAGVFMDALIGESDENLLAEIFRAWEVKGIDEEEIYQIARIMRDRCIKVSSKHKSYVDIVGTGGSGSKTFNVSTAAAFVAAGGEVPVAKHGNRRYEFVGERGCLVRHRYRAVHNALSAERSSISLNLCFI